MPEASGRVKLKGSIVLWLVVFALATAFWIWAGFFVTSQQPDSDVNLSANTSASSARPSA
jgi:hypothetical protein